MSSLGTQARKSSIDLPQLSTERVLTTVGPHVVLIAYTCLAMFPIFLTIINSFKERKNIFQFPYTLPLGDLFTLAGYQTVFKRADMLLYFVNSLVITLGSLVLILLTGAMAGYALSEYKFRGNFLLSLYMTLGILIPIRLGTVSIIRLCTSLGLTGTLQGMILIYTATGIPLSIFILSQFMRQLPSELKDAARVDGASEYRIFFQLVLPLVRPAMVSVAVFNMIPVWNDLWWPLIMASDRTKTVTLGVQTFTGQYLTDWTALLAALSLAIVPVLILYVIFSRQLIRGLTAGAVKQ
jgi:raffinose/stachyose/melibiose transport system permease protein